MAQATIKVGIAGTGAIGTAVGNALAAGEIEGMELAFISEIRGSTPFSVPNLSFAELAEKSDLIVECLSPDSVPALANEALSRGKTIVMISSAALLRFPDIMARANAGEGRIIVPSGALGGIDGVRALKSMGLRSAVIRSTKKPMAYDGAPYIAAQKIDLGAITVPTCIFSGNALDAAKAFPANVNVAATISLAGLGPEHTKVEVWADPEAPGNTHEITVRGEYSTFTGRIENQPDPKNPKTSMLAAHSIIACLQQMTEKVSVI
jgi:aspartate dehydrogenase